MPLILMIQEKPSPLLKDWNIMHIQWGKVPGWISARVWETPRRKKELCSRENTTEKSVSYREQEHSYVIYLLQPLPHLPISSRKKLKTLIVPITLLTPYPTLHIGFSPVPQICQTHSCLRVLALALSFSNMLTSFKTFFKCHLLNEADTDHAI